MLDTTLSLAERTQRDIIARRIRALQEHEVLPQGSESWLQARRVLLTASECASFLQCNEQCASEYVNEFGLQGEFRFSNRCASPYGSAKQVIKRKRGIVPPSDFGSVYTNWGHIFEGTIRQLWQHLHGDSEVQEFGLITSPLHSFLAASPDGVCPSGIILEFKAPYKRSIRNNKAPPFHYWIQTQILMECLGLPLTHYVEVEFTTLYKDEEAFLSDTLEDGEFKGCLLQSGPARSHEPPLCYFNKPSEQLEWCKENKQDGQSIVFYKILDYNLFEIKRNRRWLDTVLPILRQGWHDLIHFDTAQAMIEEEAAAEKKKTRKRKRSDTSVSPLPNEDMCGEDNESIVTECLDLCGDSSL